MILFDSLNFPFRTLEDIDVNVEGYFNIEISETDNCIDEDGKLYPDWDTGFDDVKMCLSVETNVTYLTRIENEMRIGRLVFSIKDKE